MRALLLMTVVVLVGSHPSLSQVEAAQREASLECSGSCRGLGIEKVKAGDEHCGLVPRERKDRALDLACSLSKENRKSLQSHAKERASSKCSNAGETDYHRCKSSLRRWQNVYTHVLSQRCWAECGWAYVIEPGKVPIESSTDTEESTHE